MRPRYLVAAALPLLLLPLVVAQADGGFGVAPARAEIPQAQPGQTYTVGIVVQNNRDQALQVSFNATGAAGAWASAEGSPWNVAPRSNLPVSVKVHVPSATVSGTYQAELRFTTQELQQPGGTGLGVRLSAATRLNVTVGGDAVERLVWRSVRAEPTPADEAPVLWATVHNQGNVQSRASVAVEAFPWSGTEILAHGRTERWIDPGLTEEVSVRLNRSLAPGQYRLQATAGDWTANATLVVHAVGAPIKLASIGSLDHPAWIERNKALAVVVPVSNLGNATLASVVLHVEVWHEGRRVASLESTPVTLVPGIRLNLTAYWSTSSVGTYRLVGYALYDGFETERSESLVNVREGSPGPASWFLAGLVFGPFFVAGALWSWTRWRRKV